MTGEANHSVLIVDDEPGIRVLYRDYLKAEYEVTVADSGEAALERIDDVDVCLIDRRMPGMTGGELVGRIRDRGYDLPVAMVTALEPDFDVIEMGFDDYVVKPVSGEELLTLTESLLLRRRYDDVLREYFSLASKASALRRSKPERELRANEEYRRTIDRLNETRKRATHTLETAMDNSKLEELLWETFMHGTAAPGADS